MIDIEGTKEYIKDLINETGDSGWIDGWVHGYTDKDHEHENGEEAYSQLTGYLQDIRKNISEGR